MMNARCCSRPYLRRDKALGVMVLNVSLFALVALPGPSRIAANGCRCAAFVWRTRPQNSRREFRKSEIRNQSLLLSLYAARPARADEGGAGAAASLGFKINLGFGLAAAVAEEEAAALSPAAGAASSAQEAAGFAAAAGAPRPSLARKSENLEVGNTHGINANVHFQSFLSLGTLVQIDIANAFHLHATKLAICS